jgi:uncharacterized cupin superfamily protein
MPDAPSPSPVANARDIPEKLHVDGDHWGGAFKDLTPLLRAAPPAPFARLGVNETRLPPGRALCPFHTHAREDEVFYVLRGRGVLRYGESLYDLGPGDCVSCPAGSGKAHQIANPYDEDLVYLAIGVNDAHEVATYPDSGKVLVRAVRSVGVIEKTAYMHGEGDSSPIFEMIAARGRPPS